MKIALIGFGNMGREVEKVVLEDDTHEILSISYKNQNDPLDLAGIKKADVAIDFTAPNIVLANIEQIAKLGKDIVVGTTGWYNELPHVKKLVAKYNIGLIYGQNFSIGANIFFQIVANAGSLFNKFGDYDVYGLETHHTGKKDSPSGTAKRLADIIMNQLPKKKKLVNRPLDRRITEDELHFASIRGGRNPGRHEVIFDSPADEVRLIHQAHGRRGFALGAIMAAEFIKGKKGFYSFDELF